MVIGVLSDSAPAGIYGLIPKYGVGCCSTFIHDVNAQNTDKALGFWDKRPRFLPP